MFSLFKILQVALKSILRNRLRSFLTSLGIIIGVSAVVVMVAIGEGSGSRIKTQLEGMGTNILVVFPGSSRVGGVSRGAGTIYKFTLDDFEEIKDRATLLSAVSPVVYSNAQVIGGGNNWSTSISGVSEHYLQIRNWQLASGEFFSAQDVNNRRKVVVLGKSVADELFPDSDPIGQQVRIRNTPFMVIGVLTSKGQNLMGRDQDDIMLAPVTTVLYRLKGGENIDQIYASCQSEEVIAQAEQEVTQILRDAHQLKEGQEDDFNVRNQTEMLEMASEISGVITMLLGSIAAVSLIVGGIGIMNIMLVSVTERTREIGIRLSVGARTSDIMTQFLVEASVLSCTGGVIGILLSFIIKAILMSATSVQVIIKPPIVAIAFGVAVLIGVFFGFYPARRAALLNPIDALRHE